MKTRTIYRAIGYRNRPLFKLISPLYSVLWARFSGFWPLITTSFLSFLGDGCCALCHEQSESSVGLCQNCVADLPVSQSSCESCALPLPFHQITGHHHCGRCSVSPPPVRRVMCVCLYRYPADVMVHRLKYSAELKWGRIMGLLMASRATFYYQQHGSDPTDEVDLLIPIPLSSRRYRERGYNQSLELATAISRELAIPLCPHSLLRSKHGRPQADLSAADRRRNVNNAFIAKGVKGQRVVLIDDVITTGTTVFDAARELLRAGAIAVDVWVFARTP